MKPWFLGRYSKRLADEIQALEGSGYEYCLNEVERNAGRIVITVKYPLDGKTHELSAIFPDNYPYFPFEIKSPSFPSGKHKSPYDGMLCLLKDPQKNWEIEDTLARFLETQVGKIAEAHAKPHDAEDLEAHEAAQITGHFHYQPGTVVFTGNWNINPEVSHGYLSIGIERNSDPNTFLRGAVLEVQDETKELLASLNVNLASRHSGNITARWVRLPTAPKSNNPQEILNEAIAHWPSLSTPKFHGGPDVVGVLIPEEVAYNQYEENWIFIVRYKHHSSRGQSSIQHYLARADQISEKVVQARIPRVRPLSQKRILIVGLGSLGSAFAWQMARAGIGSLHLMDFDHVHIGNAPRWMLGLTATGHSKAQILSYYLQQEYPFAQIKFWNHRLGSIKYSPSHPSDSEVLPQALEGVDLIVDATAEWCVSHFLSDLAKERGIPYVWATGTSGGWGGVVGRVVPDSTPGCWKCYQRFLSDGTIVSPNQEDTPDIQTVGCFHPTFTGAGFDMDHITLAAVRLVVSTLCAGQEAAYPNFDWDVGVVNLWDTHASPIAPHWHSYKLDKHPKCDCHG